MKRYFDATVEGHKRITVYEGSSHDDIGECLGLEQRDREIDAADLPSDFADWKRYTANAFAGGLRTVTVEVMSRDGD